MGLRILLSALARTAARYDTGVVPLFSHATNHYVRTYLELQHRATDANAAVDELGHVYHCEDCLYRETEHGLTADPVDDCPNCGSGRVITAGPVWLGTVRNPEFVATVRDAVSDDMGTAENARDLLETVESELDRPTHYDQHRLCKEWGRPAAAMDEFLEKLRAAGYEASRAHYGGTTFKTDADVVAVREATAHG
jgi:tRNA (guanine26-N2/guanine27-N2)-dimethyltransferase